MTEQTPNDKAWLEGREEAFRAAKYEISEVIRQYTDGDGPEDDHEEGLVEGLMRAIDIISGIRLPFSVQEARTALFAHQK